MLIYNPSLDPYHCAVRLLTISVMHDKDLPFETAQIIDFGFLFPEVLINARLPNSISSLRKSAREHVSPFRPAPKSKSAIRSIRSIQLSAGSTLAMNDLIDREKFKDGVLKAQLPALPESLLVACQSFLNGNKDFYTAVITSLVTVPLSGHDGLKHRTGLMEYRYDAV